MNEYNQKVEFYGMLCIQQKFIPNSKGTVYEPNRDITPEKNHPDFLLDGEIELEITTSGDGPIILPGDSTFRKRENYERSCKNMLIKLKNFTESWICPGETIIVSFLTHVPREGRSKLSQEINSQLKQWYLNRDNRSQLDKTWKLSIKTSSKEIPCLILEVYLTNFYAGKSEYSPTKIILAGSLQSPFPITQASFSEQSKCILRDIIFKKTKKSSKSERKNWLCIINTHPLLDYSSWKTSMDELQKNGLKHGFEKIFLLPPPIFAQDSTASPIFLQLPKLLDLPPLTSDELQSHWQLF